MQITESNYDNFVATYIRLVLKQNIVDHATFFGYVRTYFCREYL